VRPTIVCGDFNSTSYNTVYRVLSMVLIDSWQEGGIGPGYSWNILPGLPGLFRIDYVWHSPHFQAIRAAVEPSSGFSDHHPVVARLVLRTEPRQ
jgi:endonuclease/exonuclease/phosphatase family metal-dependent hydrolase